MSGSARAALARRRAGALLGQLSPNQSAQEQKRLILNQSCSYLPGFGYGGPAFDLEILLEDPSFRLPGRSRSETERIVAEGASGAKAGLASFAKEQHAQFMRRLLNVSIALLSVLGGIWALTHTSQIVGFIDSTLLN